jgi:hypothetical protein
MKVLIDGHEADIDERTEVSITLSVASRSELESSRTGYSKTILLPPTTNNSTLLGVPDDTNALHHFNHGDHTARIEKDGCTVLEGVPVVAESVSGDQGYYKLNIVGAGSEWVRKAAATPLRALGVEFDEALTAQNIRDSWTWNKPVRFLPVHRPSLEPLDVWNNIIPPLRTLTPDDYHPFIHLRTILERTFAEAGYTLSSQFLGGPLFDSLYISGNYPTRDVSSIRQRVDFRAGRTTEAIAWADHLGRVYASPYDSQYGLGNIVDTVDPSQNTNGVTAAGVFSNGGYFRMNDSGHMEFAPPVPVTVAFEYRIAYRTEYHIDPWTMKIKGFDTINLGGSNEYKFQLKLPFPDHKGGVLQPNHTYHLYIRNYIPGARYQRHYIEITNPYANLDNLQDGDYTVYYGNYVASPLEIIRVGDYRHAIHLVEVDRGDGEGYKSLDSSEWAIYDSSMPFDGFADIEATVRTEAVTVTSSNPKTFYDIWFGGADPWMSMTLLPGTTLRPIFTYGATEGSQLDFPSVAAHDNVSCLDIVRACKQMFNLYFLTDRRNKVVYVEPRDNFYTTTPTIDLGGRIDFSRPITVSDPASEASRVMTFCYAPADEAVAEQERLATQKNFGSYSVPIASSLAAEGEKRYANPLFAPSVNTRGGYSRAVAASLLRVGSSQNPDEANFPMKVVRYTGMKPLPAGQTWGWPGEQSQYPLLAFHEPREGISLAFEDRDKMVGLHTFWDNNLALLSGGRRVQLYVDMRPDDIEPLVCPDGQGRDFRAQYRLTIGGESAIYRLEEAADYNPATQTTTKCTFIKTHD